MTPVAGARHVERARERVSYDDENICGGIWTAEKYNSDKITQLYTT